MICRVLLLLSHRLADPSPPPWLAHADATDDEGPGPKGGGDDMDDAEVRRDGGVVDGSGDPRPWSPPPWSVE
jgi:hypothetical protein